METARGTRRARWSGGGVVILEGLPLQHREGGANDSAWYSMKQCHDGGEVPYRGGIFVFGVPHMKSYCRSTSHPDIRRHASPRNPTDIFLR